MPLVLLPVRGGGLRSNPEKPVAAQHAEQRLGAHSIVAVPESAPGGTTPCTSGRGSNVVVGTHPGGAAGREVGWGRH